MAHDVHAISRFSSLLARRLFAKGSAGNQVMIRREDIFPISPSKFKSSFHLPVEGLLKMAFRAQPWARKKDSPSPLGCKEKLELYYEVLFLAHCSLASSIMSKGLGSSPHNRHQSVPHTYRLSLSLSLGEERHKFAA